MADILVAGAGATAALYLLFKSPVGQGGVQQEVAQMYGNTEGAWKPNNYSAWTGTSITEHVASDVPSDVLTVEPENGRALMDPKFIGQKVNSINQRNVMNTEVYTTQLFDPYRFGKIRSAGTAAPTPMCLMGKNASVVNYETPFDYSPFVLRDYRPIQERQSLFDYGPFVHRPDYAAVKLDQDPKPQQYAPVKPATTEPKRAIYPQGKRIRMNPKRMVARV